MNSVSQINVECNGKKSCKYTSFTFIGINNISINCAHEYACYDVRLSAKTLNDIPSGSVTVNCVEGIEVCKYLSVDGISMSSVNVLCPDNDNSCREIQVYCPIHPFGSIITNQSSIDYYTYDNINKDSCRINLAFRGDDADIFTIYGTQQTRIERANPDGFSKVYCGFDWSINRFHLLASNPSFDDHCDNGTYIQDKYISKLISTDVSLNNDIGLLLSDPHSYKTKCPAKDCIVYASPKINPSTCIECPIEPFTCTVYWYVYIWCFSNWYIFKTNIALINMRVLTLLLMGWNQKH